MPDHSPGSAFAAVLVRDLRLHARSPGDAANPVLFLVMVTALFPLAIGASTEVLARIAPGIIWVAALLSSILSMDTVFRADFEDGTLEQLALAPSPLALLILAKLAAHWLVTALPLILVSPLLALWMHFPATAIPALMATLALGTPVLSGVGAIAAALTLGVGRGGALLALLALPLYVPVLIFGAGAADAAASGLSVSGPLQLLGAMTLFTITLAPIAVAAGLRISLD
ncbi:heme exporter protein CcmB [Aquisalimonas lutea]|uniref:heme exporter protein CcmB n=1 Tax=Aquisalimonas lutea TaxID=1327750 RepID=UPI0025B46F16|nr:heme exporter protein CcmB [Aquisalimonas lutea]MDN3519076.1 heme exporter protein CcmB [Aquisalimonas lutea]